MLTGIQWFYLLCTWISALAGGYLPLTRSHLARGVTGFPRSEAFSSGVFLALSLFMLLPASIHTFHKIAPGLNFPIASVVALLAFIALLAMEHLAGHVIHEQSPGPAEENEADDVPDRISSLIPLVMTSMIALPSFLLGAALGVSDQKVALLIFIAILLHKGTAAFALALAMVRSRLKNWQTVALFLTFSLLTPAGILAGASVKGIGSQAILLQAVALALGAGCFLYMGTLHEMKRATLIKHCCHPSCFIAMVLGVAVTAGVRWLIGESHHL